VPSRLQIVLQDSDNRKGVFDIPVADVALPAGYQTKIDAVTALLGGTTTNFLTSSTVFKSRVIIESAENNVLPASSDIRNTWKISAVAPAEDEFTFSLPGRLTLGALTTEVSKGALLDTALAVWTNFLAALAAAGVDLQSPLAASAVPLGARALTTRRERPRI